MRVFKVWAKLVKSFLKSFNPGSTLLWNSMQRVFAKSARLLRLIPVEAFWNEGSFYSNCSNTNKGQIVVPWGSQSPGPPQERNKDTHCPRGQSQASEMWACCQAGLQEERKHWIVDYVPVDVYVLCTNTSSLDWQQYVQIESLLINSEKSWIWFKFHLTV